MSAKTQETMGRLILFNISDQKIRVAAVERGFYTASFYCALFPTRLEHLVIPRLNTSFATFNRVLAYAQAGMG